MKFHRDNDMAIDKENSVVPMTEVYVNVTSTPNTPVLVSVFDKSLSLLAGSCDIGKKSSVRPCSCYTGYRDELIYAPFFLHSTSLPLLLLGVQEAGLHCFWHHHQHRSQLFC